MLLSAKFLQFIKLLFDFMNVVLTIRKHSAVNSFKIINITKFDAADLIVMITKYNERFRFNFINELMYFFVYLVTPYADLLFFCRVYYFDKYFDNNHPRKFELKLAISNHAQVGCRSGNGYPKPAHRLNRLWSGFYPHADATLIHIVNRSDLQSV